MNRLLKMVSLRQSPTPVGRLRCVPYGVYVAVGKEGVAQAAPARRFMSMRLFCQNLKLRLFVVPAQAGTRRVLCRSGLRWNDEAKFLPPLE